MKKKQTKKSAATTVAAAQSAPSSLPPIGGADALPSIEAPTPPIDDNPVAMDPRSGTRVLQAQVDVAANAAKELRSSALFPEVLTSRLGSAESIADALDFAAQWYAQAKAGATWASYTQMQSNLAWNYALAMIDRLRAAFQAVAATDPAIEKELPNFTKLLSARQAVAAKAVATKRKIKSGEIVVNKSAKPPRKGTTSSKQATSTEAAPAAASAEAAPAPNGTAGAPGVTSVTTGANGVTNGAAH
jgi:hypothetical protein